MACGGGDDFGAVRLLRDVGAGRVVVGDGRDAGLHEGAWAGAISVFAVLAVVGMALRYRRHRALPPLVLAALGAALIVWVMFGVYHLAVELAGFALLVAATIWDWRVKQKETAAAS